MPSPPPQSPVHRSTVSRHFDAYLAKYGRWFVHAAPDRRFPCASHDPDTGGDSPGNIQASGCPVCLGTGFRVTRKRIHGFLTAPLRALAFGGGEPIAEWGRLDKYPGLLYTRFSNPVRQADLLFDVEWDRPSANVGAGGRPTRLVIPWRMVITVPVIFNEEAAVDYVAVGLEQHVAVDHRLLWPLTTDDLPADGPRDPVGPSTLLGRAARR